MLILYNYLNYHSMFSKPYILKRRNIKTIIIKKNDNFNINILINFTLLFIIINI